VALTPRQIKDSLGRVKAYYQRKEITRALESTIYAFQNLPMPLTMDIRSSIREAIQLIAKDEQVKKFLTAPMIYQPGNEKDIYKMLVLTLKKIEEENALGSYKEDIARKINLDKFFNEGTKALGNKHVSEADECFTKALTYYKDEHHVFFMIAKALKDAGEIRRAYPYAKRGAEVAPTSEQLQQLYKEIGDARKLLT